MAIVYRIYTNHGTGGPVDYSAPLATTSAVTYVTGPLAPSTDTTFVVRAYDPGSGFEEANTEASVRVVVGADGRDVSLLPNPPHALVLAPAAGGGGRVSWAYAPDARCGAPGSFLVYLTQGTAVDYSTPAATVAYTPGQVGYSCVLPGPYAHATYTAAVRSSNATGTEANTATASGQIGATDSYAMEAVLVTVS